MQNFSSVYGLYVLRENETVPSLEPSVLKWGEYMRTANRHVARTEKDGVTVSTIFLGMDCNFSFQGEPLFFETMVFNEDNKKDNRLSKRYMTWEQAEKGHEQVCKRIFKETKKAESQNK